VRCAIDVQIHSIGGLFVCARSANDVMTDQVVQALRLIDAGAGVHTPVPEGQGRYWSLRWLPGGTRIV